MDAPMDAAADVSPDTPMDTAVDAPMDTAMDVPTDASMDVPTDTPMDVPMDTPMDVPTDTSMDTLVDGDASGPCGMSCAADEACLSLSTGSVCMTCAEMEAGYAALVAMDSCTVSTDCRHVLGACDIGLGTECYYALNISVAISDVGAFAPAWMSTCTVRDRCSTMCGMFPGPGTRPDCTSSTCIPR